MIADNIRADLIILISVLFKEKGFDFEIIEYADLIDDLSRDSITFISMVVEIEAKFDIEVPDDFLIMDYFRNVDAVVKIIADEISRKTNEAEVAGNV